MDVDLSHGNDDYDPGGLSADSQLLAQLRISDQCRGSVDPERLVEPRDEEEHGHVGVGDQILE